MYSGCTRARGLCVNALAALQLQRASATRIAPLIYFVKAYATLSFVFGKLGLLDLALLYQTFVCACACAFAGARVCERARVCVHMLSRETKVSI